MLADNNSGTAEQKMDSDPLEVNKDPQLIKETQQEISQLDVLVCGKCHDIFHYIEQLQEHREKCDGTSKFRDLYKNDVKPPEWAFLLWKNNKCKEGKDADTTASAWSLYQEWSQLNATDKQNWVSAANGILTCTRLGAGRLLETSKAHQEVAAIVKRKYNKHSIDGDKALEPGEIRGSVAASKRAAVQDKKPATKGKQVSPAEIGPKKIVENRKALRTCKNDIIVVGAIDKIMDRRFNTQKQCLEYLIKWGAPNDNVTTWEPKNHIERCATLLEEFEKNFYKKKVNEKKNDSQNIILNDSGRPQRSSKQKALNQVKAWCGDITDDEPIKRKYVSDEDDGDSTDSFEKKIKMEDDSDSSEDEKPMVTIRKVAATKQGTNSFNGISNKKADGSTASPTSQPQRVIRVNQKQLPTLASGVYVMSKTDGIIKIDSNNPAASSSSTSPLLKVGGKIGQTHIKMIKKEQQDSTGGKVQKLAGKGGVSAEVQKGGQPKPQFVVSKKGQVQNVPKGVKIVEQTEQDSFSKLPVDDDSDDGIEEMEFPTDLPLPRPDSPPGEFTLCPLTGRILDKNGQPQPEPEIIQIKSEPLPEPTSLENIVKLAVMDTDVSAESNENAGIAVSGAVTPATTITATSNNVSLSSRSPVSVLNASASATPLKNTPAIAAKVSTISTSIDLEKSITQTSISKAINRPNVPPANTHKPSSPATSILNKVLTNPKTPQISTRIIEHHPKKMLHNTPNVVRQQKFVHKQGEIHKPPIHKPSPTTSIIYKVSSGNRGRQPVLPRTSPQHEPVLKRTSNVTTYKPASVARKIGNTMIYKTEKPKPSPVVISSPVSTAIASTTLPTTPLARTQTLTTQSAVISMPLLNDEEMAGVHSSAATVLDTTTTTPSEASSTILQTTQQQQDSTLPVVEMPAVVENVGELAGASELATYSLPETETPILITSEDGTIYQVAGQNEEGQTILISEGPDGTQQCVIVSSDSLAEELPSEMTAAGTVAATAIDAQQAMETADEHSLEQSEYLNLAEPSAEGDAAESDENQVVAQIIKADPPSPGGTRKVVLMLPDGNLMMTSVTAEQYAALELDK